MRPSGAGSAAIRQPVIAARDHARTSCPTRSRRGRSSRAIRASTSASGIGRPAIGGGHAMRRTGIEASSHAVRRLHVGGARTGASADGASTIATLAGKPPSARRARSGVPAAAVPRILAGPLARPSRDPAGGAMSGSAIDGRFRSRPEVHDQQRDRRRWSSREKPEDERRSRESTAPSTPPARWPRNAACSARSAQQIAVQRVGGGVGLALGEVELASLERRSARRDRRASAGPRNAATLGNCAQEFGAALSNRCGQLRSKSAKYRNGAGRREFLSLEQHRRAGRQQQVARSSRATGRGSSADGRAARAPNWPPDRGSAGRRRSGCGGRSSAGVPRGLPLPVVVLALEQVAVLRGGDELLRRRRACRCSTPRPARSAPPSRCDGSRRSTARRGRSRPCAAGRTSRVSCGSFSATMIVRRLRRLLADAIADRRHHVRVATRRRSAAWRRAAGRRGETRRSSSRRWR